MKDKKVIFMGTPLYSVPVLEMLIKKTNVVLVITQPDKFVGRKKILTPCPVKRFALDNNIEVISPVKIKEEVDKIAELEPDLIVTCAYGQIIPEEIIYTPKCDTVNVHASLLPKYRGGAPIQRAIMNGDKEIGVTIMYTDKGMDSGDIIKSESFKLDVNDTYDVIRDKMSVLGAELLEDVLPSVFDGSCPRIVQDESLVSFAPVISREDEHISFDNNSIDVHNKIRALSEVPGAYAVLDNKNIKILLSTLEDCQITNSKFGTITRCDKNGIFVSCNDNEIKILKIQIPGKKPVMVKDYLNGINKDSIIGKIFM